MSAPILTLVFDRKKKATRKKEGSVELRITFARQQKYIATGVRLLSNQWKDGLIINRYDASEVDKTLIRYIERARKIVNEQVNNGTFDITTIGQLINEHDKAKSTENLPEHNLLIDYFRDRATIRKYGRGKDSQERYDRFLKWFENWGGMLTFEDITEVNIMHMDEALGDKMKPCSKWGNYHRFLNAFIIDAINDGILRKNPYKSLHIKKDKNNDDSINKFLTKEEFDKIAHMYLPTPSLCHARDLFVFQTYTCLAYVDLKAFNPSQIRVLNDKFVYSGRRGKTNQYFSFLIMKPAMEILMKYNMQLPVISNQKYNDYIKMIAVMAGINKPVSSHWARHTGATLLLNNGVSMEIVSRVLGHSSTKMTREIYAKLLDDTVANAMANVTF